MPLVTRSVSLLSLALAIGCGQSTAPTPDLGFLVQAIGTPPTTAVAGSTVQLTAKVLHKETGGGTTPAAGKTLTLTVTAGGGTVNGATSATVTTATDGSASATWVLGSTVGAQTLRGSVSATEFLDFTLTATAPPATQLVLATVPSTGAQSGAALAVQPQVQLKDANGANVAEAGVQVTATIETGGGTLGGTPTVATNASGLAVFTDLSISGTVGNRTLKFSATLAGGTATVTSAQVALTAGAAAQLAMKTQPSATTPRGFTLLQQPAVQLQDAAGNLVAQGGVVVTASVFSGTPTATTDATGAATFTNLMLYGSTGVRTLGFAATLGGQSRTVTSAPVTVNLPNNGKLAFKSGKDALWVVNSDGSGLSQLTTGYGSSTCIAGDEEPRWSPDGSKIVFVRTQNGSQEIWVMNADGSSQTKLTNDGDGTCSDETGTPGAGTFSENASWSPDGTKIIFTSDRSNNSFEEDLWIMNADGTGQTKLFGNVGTTESEAFFSPDGQTIAFQVAVARIGLGCQGGDEDGSELWLINADGTNPRRLTTTVGCSTDENLAWAADGQKISYTRNITPSFPCFDELFIININGTNATQLTNCHQGSGSEHPAFSPDGTRIVFANGSGNDTIWLMNPDGSGKVIVGLGVLIDNGMPNWQPIR